MAIQAKWPGIECGCLALFPWVVLLLMAQSWVRNGHCGKQSPSLNRISDGPHCIETETPLGDKSQALVSNHPARSELPMEDERETLAQCPIGEGCDCLGNPYSLETAIAGGFFCVFVCLCLYVCEHVRACTCLLVCMASAFMN